MLGGGALDLEIAILQRGEVRRELAKGFIWFLSGSSSLTTGASPAQAAAIAGFDSQPAFGVAFRELFGITSGQARSLQTARPR